MVQGRGMESEDYEGMFHWMTQSGQTQSVAEARQLFATRFADPSETHDRRIESLNAQMDKLREPTPITFMDTMRAGWGEFTDAFAAPFREFEGAMHDAFDSMGTFFTDQLTGRTRITQKLGIKQATQGRYEGSLAARAAVGNLTASESTFMEETMAEYTAHLQTTGGVRDRSQYKIYNSESVFFDKEAEDEFNERLAIIGETLDAATPTMISWNDDRMSLLPRNNESFSNPVTSYGTFNADEHLQDILTGFSQWQGAGITYLGGVETSTLDEKLGDDFTFGRISHDWNSGLGKKEFQGIPWSARDIGGVDSLIVAQMMSEGTLTREGE
jgi:hypothetical protein